MNNWSYVDVQYITVECVFNFDVDVLDLRSYKEKSYWYEEGYKNGFKDGSLVGNEEKNDLSWLDIFLIFIVVATAVYKLSK